MSSGGVALGLPGQVASWIGFVVHASTTVYCMRTALTHHSKTSRMYHYISIVVTTVASLAYLYMAMAAVRGEGAYWVHFAEWICTTPLLLVDLGMLSRMGMPEIALIMVADVLMIGSGYASEIAPDPLGLWGMYAFSCAMFAVIMWSVITHLRDVIAHPGTHPAESKAFVFLSLWTVTFWSGYVAVWTIIKLGVVSADAGAIIYTLMDINAKDVFGLTIFGLRDVLAGHDTALAALAMMLTGVTRAMRLRRNSVDEETAMRIAQLANIPAVAFLNPTFNRPAPGASPVVEYFPNSDIESQNSQGSGAEGVFQQQPSTSKPGPAGMGQTSCRPPTTTIRASFREETGPGGGGAIYPYRANPQPDAASPRDSTAEETADNIVQAMRSDPSIVERIRRALEQEVHEEGLGDQ